MRKKLLLSFGLVVLVGYAGMAQKQSTYFAAPRKTRFSVGIKAEHHTYDLFVNGRVARYSIKNWEGIANAGEGWRLGVFGRTGGPKWYLQPELTYFYGTTFVGFVNHAPIEEYQGPGQYDWIASEGGSTHRRAEAVLLGGRRLVRHLHVQLGPVLSYHFQDPQFAGRAINRNDQILHDFNQSYRAVYLSGRASIGAEWGPVLLTLSHERTLTPMATHVVHAGQRYPLRQSARQVQVALALRLYRWKAPATE
jgi:hypothetical protein